MRTIGARNRPREKSGMRGSFAGRSGTFNGLVARVSAFSERNVSGLLRSSTRGLFVSRRIDSDVLMNCCAVDCAARTGPAEGLRAPRRM